MRNDGFGIHGRATRNGGHRGVEDKFVGTSQSNRCGSDSKEVAAERKKTKKGSYEGKFWVHKTKPLCVAIWADNAHVLTLSNHHSPRFHNEANGVRRRKRNKNGTRDQLPSWVKIPEQTKRYVETFFRIDQKNKHDSQFNLKIVSKKHNWAPKIVMRLMNMHL